MLKSRSKDNGQNDKNIYQKAGKKMAKTDYNEEW